MKSDLPFDCRLFNSFPRRLSASAFVRVLQLSCSAQVLIQLRGALSILCAVATRKARGGELRYQEGPVFIGGGGAGRSYWVESEC